MLLDKANMQLLKLVAQCKDLPRNHAFSGTTLFAEANIHCLLKEELLYLSKDGRHYRTTRAGYDLLQQYGYDMQADEYRESAEITLARREGCAHVCLTLLLAGVDVFTSGVQELQGASSYLPSSSIRRWQRGEGRNLIGNTRFTGMTGSGLSFYYVADPQDKLFYRYETKTTAALLATARRESAAGDIFAGTSPAVVYMGKDYASLLAAVTSPVTTKATYRSAYDKFTMPLYLCPCNPDGAFQMRVILQEDYRNRLMEAMFDHSPIPNPFYTGSDGMIEGEPFVLALDMDLRRITRMTEAARKNKLKSHIFARRCQCEALREVLPGNDVKLYAISDEDILRVFSFSSFLSEPPLEPYITKEGEFIHDQALRACREARKAHRQKDKAP